MRVPVAALLALTLATSTAHAEVKTVHTETISFSRCLGKIVNVAMQFKVQPITVVSTGILRVVRFPVDDGSVLFSCSKLDNKLVITQSDKRG